MNDGDLIWILRRILKMVIILEKGIFSDIGLMFSKDGSFFIFLLLKVWKGKCWNECICLLEFFVFLDLKIMKNFEFVIVLIMVNLLCVCC